MNLFEDKEEELIEKICSSCKKNICDHATGLCSCIACDGDYTDRHCEYYAEWWEIQAILDEAGKAVEDKIEECR